MNRKEVINQLKELVEDRKSFMVGDYDEVYDKDVQALEYVIKELTAQEVPVQEQLCGINKKVDSIQICLTIFSVAIIVMLINVLFN
jgi:hypothetical protein